MKDPTTIQIRKTTHKRALLRKTHLEMEFDEFINYLLDCEKKLLKLKK